MSSTKAHIAPPRNTLRDKVGAPPTFDARALAKAEAALQSLSSEFDAWMAQEVERILAARQAARTRGYGEGELAAIHACAHDIKGLGATYDYPLATLIAGSLCRLVETPAGRARAAGQIAIVDAHIDAIRAAVAAGIRSGDHPVGKELLSTLQAKVDALTAGIAEASF